MSAFNNIIPIMTSDTAPSGQVFSSGILSASYFSFYAFTSNLAQSWTSSQIAYPHYLGYKFDSTTEIGGYSISSRNLDGNDLTAMVRDWELEGSNDGFVYTKIDSQRNVVWVSKGEEKIFQLKEKVSFSYFRIKILSNNGYSSTVSTVGRLQLFDGKSVKTEKKLTIKSASTDELYSLSNNTLIHLPDNTTECIIEYGLEQGKYIQLDVPFDKHKYFNETPVASVNGKVFTHDIGKINTLSIKEIREEKSVVTTWYETKMTSDTSPSPLVASSSSLYTPSTVASWKAFNGTTTDSQDAWASQNNVTDAYIVLDYGEKKAVDRVMLTSVNGTGTATFGAKNFEVSGSNDNSDWTLLHSELNIPQWGNSEKRMYSFDARSEFRYYKLRTWGAYQPTLNYVAIGDILYGLREVK
ncbi:discoidin domain-containing protein [Lysinibacillus fusiformis]|uniref:discoidin domain-containing protein n=1 Tax=Lysinibacillus fusiformis TaxID=28031 RepID=UPI0021BE6652|nr:discoidin domain-containing protein [Lysinibacillus fusiformis]UXJ70197.1 discoidin domain-containing protein [Lysinibacillus fusiformis]